MLWYSFLEKRGGYIKKLINWSLLNDGKIIINNENIECEFEANKFIKYQEDKNTFNLINLKEESYLRENDEFIFKIDFKNKLFNYILKENDFLVEDKISCSMLLKNSTIVLKYKIDEEEKKIIIQIL